MALAPDVAPTFASSNQGAVAVLPLGAAEQADVTQLTWIDRAGRVETRLDAAAGGRRPSLSPDGRRVAVGLRSGVWVIDLARGVQSRVVLGVLDTGAVWSPDSRRLIFNRPNYQATGKDVMIETRSTTSGREARKRWSGY